MRVPLLWLSDYVDLPVGAEAIAERLTMAGIEVERIESVGSHWGSAVRVGEVVSIDPHPNADRLLLVTVDFGEGRLQVVTRRGQFRRRRPGPAGPGRGDALQRLQGRPPAGGAAPGQVARRRKPRDDLLRGPNWEYPKITPGSWCFPRTRRSGRSWSPTWAGETVELDLKPDRSDCLAMLGVARYVAGLFEQDFKPPQLAEHRVEGELPALGGLHRGRRGLPPLLGRLPDRRAHRALAGLAGAAPGGGRTAPDQQHRRHHQLRHARVRSAAARVRLRQAGRKQHRRAARAGWRGAPDPGPEPAPALARGPGDRRLRGSGRAGRCHGRFFRPR